jgi:hypothetical protein
MPKVYRSDERLASSDTVPAARSLIFAPSLVRLADCTY